VSHDSLNRTFLDPLLSPEHPSAIAIMDQDGAHSFDAIRNRAFAFAQGFHERGDVAVSSMPRAALVAEGSAEFAGMLFGLMLAGFVPVVVSSDYPSAELAHILGDAGALFACVPSRVARDRPDLVSRLRDHFRTIRTESPLAREPDELAGKPAALADPVIVSLVHDSSEALSADALRAMQARQQRRDQRQTPALQLYTSGTTARPKGAVLSFENLAVQAREVGRHWRVSTSDRLLHALPMHHMHGLAIAFFTAFFAGATTEFLGKFKVIDVWARMQDATIYMAVPTMYAKLLAAYDEADAATKVRWQIAARGLRLATSGSAALPTTLANAWRTVTGTIPLERFGMTEVGVGITNPFAADLRQEGTVGKALNTVRIKVVDEQEQEASEGELWIGGPSVFLGYHNNAIANDQSFVLQSGERWFRTGDRVRVEPDEYVRMLGRTSVDILKSGGYKISALEVEEVLRESSFVEDVAVVGLDDATWGQIVCACLVLKPSPTVALAVLTEETELELRRLMTDKLASYKAPRRYVALASFPRNHLGKVQKPVLAKLVVELKP
jgi:malonyl-CoA/methylmalonyl-CoA synthetase